MRAQRGWATQYATPRPHTARVGPSAGYTVKAPLRRFSATSSLSFFSCPAVRPASRRPIPLRIQRSQRLDTMLRREQYVCARRHALEHGAHIDAADGAKVVERRRAGLLQRFAPRFDGEWSTPVAGAENGCPVAPYPVPRVLVDPAARAAPREGRRALERGPPSTRRIANRRLCLSIRLQNRPPRDSAA
jgi:hypothetical protein